MHHLGFKKRNSCNVSKRLCYAKLFRPQEISSAIINFHAIAGADAVSSLYGHLKKIKYNKIKISSEVQKLIFNLGKNDAVPEDDIIKCSEYMVNYINGINGDRGSITLAEARPTKWRSMKNITFRLSPDGDSFVQYLLWANYQARTWYNFKTPDGSPNPLHYGYFQEASLIPTPNTKEA